MTPREIQKIERRLESFRTSHYHVAKAMYDDRFAIDGLTDSQVDALLELAGKDVQNLLKVVKRREAAKPKRVRFRAVDEFTKIALCPTCEGHGFKIKGERQ